MTAVASGDGTHIAGRAYRALCCIAQILFALNRRCLIDETGVLEEAAAFPRALGELTDRTAGIRAAIGAGQFGAAPSEPNALAVELRTPIRVGSPRCDPPPSPRGGSGAFRQVGEAARRAEHHK